MSYGAKYTKPSARPRRQGGGAQLDWFRRAHPKSLVEDEDWIDESDRYVDSLKAAQSIVRRRSQSRRMGKKTGQEED
jgi:hypothetical protein